MFEKRYSRRDFVRSGVLAGAGLVVPGALLGACAPAARGTALPGAAAEIGPGWDAVPGILARIRPPRFPARDFPITRYGAAADAGADSSAAIRRAIDDCHRAGGGRVVVPAGRFRTGPIHLRSNVELHVAEGATLLFSTDPADYPTVHTRWEGVELMGYSPLVYAFEQENIAITGSGTLDGQAADTNWWPWKGAWKTRREWANVPNQLPARARLFEMAEQGVPAEQRVFAEGSYLRPQFIQPYRCRNVLIEGVTILRSPMWQVHPVLCSNVTVRNLRIVSHGPNNDGCNPESCRDVLIEGCYFDTGDDCIAIKSGRNADGRRLATPSQNIVIRGCRMKDGHGGVTIGSEISGGVSQVYAEDCEMDSPNLDRVLRFKTNAMRGGLLEHIYMRNVRVGQVSDAIVHIDFHYEEGAAGPHRPVVRNIDVRNVTSTRSRYAFYLRGFPESPIRGVHVADCRFENVERGSLVEHVTEIALERVVVNGAVVRELAATR
jgi:polygalacturonase